MRAEEVDDSLLVLQVRHEHVEVHPVDPLDRQPDMTADDLGHALCYHLLGSGRAGFASRRRLDRSSVLETGLTRARHEPAIGATKSTRLVGLRRSLASISLLEHTERSEIGVGPLFTKVGSLVLLDDSMSLVVQGKGKSLRYFDLATAMLGGEPGGSSRTGGDAAGRILINHARLV